MNINAAKHKIRKSGWIWIRDIAIFSVIVSGIIYWQTKDMLSTNGSTVIKQQYLYTLADEHAPLLVADKPNLVYFFAPWCQICALSIGNLEYLDDDKINITVVALDYTNKQDVYDFVERNDVKQTVLMGDNNIRDAFAIQGYPSYYLLNEEFIVTSRSFGYSSAAGLKLREAFGH